MIAALRTRFPSPALFAISYAVIAAIVVLVLPKQALWDERLFYPEIYRLATDWPGLKKSITELQSPMGPLYFWVYSLILRITDASWVLMRILHLWISGALLYHIATYLSTHRFSWVTWLAFMFYPYFLVMCGPLLYTDVLGLLLCYVAIRLYYEKDSYLLAGLLWGLALWTRQLLIIIPLAAGISSLFTTSSVSAADRLKSIMAPLFAGVLFLPLYMLWDGVNSGNFPDGMYAENSLSAFRFTFQDLNYSLALIGLWVLPATLLFYRSISLKVFGGCFVVALVQVLIALPTQVNADMSVGHLPDTAGLLDIVLSWTSYGAYPLSAVLVASALYLLLISLKYLVDSHIRFQWLAILLFMMLEASYSYCWDKHSLLVAPLILHLSVHCLSKSTTLTDIQEKTILR